MNLEAPVTFQIRIVRVRCPVCKKPFPLPTPESLPKHARVTPRSRDLALSLIVQTNGSLDTSGDVAEEFGNLHIPRSTLHDWKMSSAGDVNHKDIITELEFSGVLCVDEFRPSREKVFDLFASDRLKGRILYLDETDDKNAVCGECAKKFYEKLKYFGISPWGIIADMGGGIMKGGRDVFPDALYQYDYFHVMQSVHDKLKKEIRSVWWKMKKDKQHEKASFLWDAQWTLLRNFERWSLEDEETWDAVGHLFPNTMIARLPAFKQELRDVFDESRDRTEALERRDAWVAHWNTSLEGSRYLQKIVALMTSHLFPPMIVYLDHPKLPRTTNAETMIRNYRHMEKARYGFGSIQGRQNHLKLYQRKKYLAQKVG